MNIPLNIDLQQILLHLFNFAILAFGLFFLLFKPVKDFMAKREAHYAAMNAEAEEHLAKAKETEELYRQQLSEADNEIAEKRREAIAEAEKLSDRRIREAEAKAKKLIAEARENAERERDSILENARDEVSEMAVIAVKKLMTESVSDSYDEFLSAAERSAANEQL